MHIRNIFCEEEYQQNITECSAERVGEVLHFTEPSRRPITTRRMQHGLKSCIEVQPYLHGRGAAR